MILHICDERQAQEFERTGWITAPSLDDAGFLHCSDPGTVAIPANRLYAGREDLVLLEIDPRLVSAPIRWEPGDPPIQDGPWFPHVYGPVEYSAVVTVHQFAPGTGGKFALPVTLARR